MHTCACLQGIHACDNFYRRPWFDCVQVRGAEGCQNHFGQLRLLFRVPALKPSGEHTRMQAALVRWFKRTSAPADVLSSYGCDRVQWEQPGSAYQVIPLACIVRREYVVPDFTRPAQFFYISRFRADRTVPDNRTYAAQSSSSSSSSSSNDSSSDSSSSSSSHSEGGNGGNKAVRLTLVLRLTLQGRVLTVRLRGWTLRSEGVQTAFWAQ